MLRRIAGDSQGHALGETQRGDERTSKRARSIQTDKFDAETYADEGNARAKGVRRSLEIPIEHLEQKAKRKLNVPAGVSDAVTNAGVIQ